MSDRKRQKTIKNEIFNSIIISSFEQLPNELILMCFAYFDYYAIYKLFSGLNQRFNQLIQYKANLYINLNSIPQGKFLTYCIKLIEIITTTQNYPLSLVAHDKYTFKLILQDDLFKSTFTQLKSLSLSGIDIRTIYSIIFNDTRNLYQRLERLILVDLICDEYEEMSDAEELCATLISSQMELLKYLHLSFRAISCVFRGDIHLFEEHSCISFYKLARDESSSHLETLIFGNISDRYYHDYKTTTVCFHSLAANLLPCVPKLKQLIINSVYLRKNHYSGPSITPLKTAVLPSNLKVIKIWINTDNMNQDEVEKYTNLIRNFCMNHYFSDTTTIEIHNIKKKGILA